MQWIHPVVGLGLIRLHQTAPKVGDLRAKTPSHALLAHSTTSNVEQVHIYTRFKLHTEKLQ